MENLSTNATAGTTTTPAPAPGVSTAASALSVNTMEALEETIKAATTGPLVIGLKCTTGTVLAAEVPDFDPFLSHDEVRVCIETITGHTAATYSGLAGDFRNIIAFARKRAQSYTNQLKKYASVVKVVKDIQERIHSCTLKSTVRPVACYIILTGWDGKQPYLMQLDPSGKNCAYNVTALGGKSQEANEYLAAKYSHEMTLDDLTKLAQATFEAVSDTKNLKLEIGVCNETGFQKHETILRRANISPSLPSKATVRHLNRLQ